MSFRDGSPDWQKELSNTCVYVVTTGDYSDYHICAIFSTREKAQEYAKLHFNLTQDEPDDFIEEWRLDIDPAPRGVWEAGCYNILDPQPRMFSEYHEPDEIPAWHKLGITESYDHQGKLWATAIARNPVREKAIKAVQDLIYLYRAEHLL